MPTDSNLTVSLLKPEEARQYMQIRHETFRPTVNKILYSRGEASPKTLDRVTQEIQEGIENGILYLKCTDSTNGEVVAGARWRHVKPKEAGAKQRTWEEVEEGFKIPEPYDESDPELVTALHTLFNKHKKEILGTQPYFVLDTLVTHPDHHRRGAGGLLLTWGCERADQEGLEVYLEASPMGEPLYARYGFERIKEITLDLRPFGGNEVMRFILMKRPAKSRTP